MHFREVLDLGILQIRDVADMWKVTLGDFADVWRYEVLDLGVLQIWGCCRSLEGHVWRFCGCVEDQVLGSHFFGHASLCSIFKCGVCDLP